MTTRAEYEALAVRVETEEPSRELRYAIAKALGLDVDPAPRMLDSLDAAAALVPEGWRLFMVVGERDGSILAALISESSRWGRRACSRAPTEPRARTAAALRALAQEAKDE